MQGMRNEAVNIVSKGTDVFLLTIHALNQLECAPRHGI